MDLNRIGKKIDDTCGEDHELSQMLKEIFAFQRTEPGWYKKEYKEIIEKHIREDDSNEN